MAYYRAAYRNLTQRHNGFTRFKNLVSLVKNLVPLVLLTYLRLSNCKLGLLINFNSVLFKDGVKRVINGVL